MSRDEGVDFFGRGRQPDEIERGAADQDALFGGTGGLESLSFELGEDEMVDGAARGGGVLDFGDRGLAHFLEGPEGPLFGGDNVIGSRGFDWGGALRPYGAGFDPAGNGVDLLGFELAAGAAF